MLLSRGRLLLLPPPGFLSPTQLHLQGLVRRQVCVCFLSSLPLWLWPTDPGQGLLHPAFSLRPWCSSAPPPPPQLCLVGHAAGWPAPGSGWSLVPGAVRPTGAGGETEVQSQGGGEHRGGSGTTEPGQESLNWGWRGGSVTQSTGCSYRT